MQAAARLAGLPDELFKPYQREALERPLDEYEEAMTYSLDFLSRVTIWEISTRRLAMPKKQRRCIKAAIEIDDLFYPAKANLAMLYNAQGRNEEAEKLLREIVEDYPGTIRFGLFAGALAR